MAEEQKNMVIRCQGTGMEYAAITKEAGQKRKGLAGNEAAMEVGKEQFRAERLYLMSLSVAKSMLENGIISEGEFTQIGAMLREKYRPVLGTLLAGKPLL